MKLHSLFSNRVAVSQIGNLPPTSGIHRYVAEISGSVHAEETGSVSIQVDRPGKRSSDWLKVKARLQLGLVVGGFTEGRGSRKHFGALLLGGIGTEIALLWAFWLHPLNFLAHPRGIFEWRLVDH